MTQDRTTVSVVITTYKRPSTLVRAIKSVKNQNLGQKIKVELIVVDDNSDGDDYRVETELLMKQFSKNDSIKYIKHSQNMNGAAARNTGIENATGKYVTFLDDDDVYMPERLIKLVSVLEDSKKDLVYSNYVYVKNGKVVSVPSLKVPDDGVFELLRQDSFFGTGSNFICLTENVRKIGSFDVRFERHQDIEFMIRYLSNYSITHLDEVLVVKHIDSKINVPNAKKMEEVKKIFLSTFKPLIDTYEPKKATAIYRSNLLELFKIVAWNNKKPSSWMNEQINLYGGLSIGDKATVMLKLIQSKVSTLDNIRHGLVRKKFNYDQRRVEKQVISWLKSIESEIA